MVGRLRMFIFNTSRDYTAEPVIHWARTRCKIHVRTAFIYAVILDGCMDVARKAA